MVLDLPGKYFLRLWSWVLLFIRMLWVFSKQVLKLYAWEPSFQEKIAAIRDNETRILKKNATYSAFSSFSFTTAPFLVNNCIYTNKIICILHLKCKCPNQINCASLKLEYNLFMVVISVIVFHILF